MAASGPDESRAARTRSKTAGSRAGGESVLMRTSYRDTPASGGREPPGAYLQAGAGPATDAAPISRRIAPGAHAPHSPGLRGGRRDFGGNGVSEVSFLFPPQGWGKENIPPRLPE